MSPRITTIAVLIAAVSGAVPARRAVAQTTNSTVVGNGVDPGEASLCPGGAATMLDAFTLGSSGFADSASSVTVTLTPTGAYANVRLVEITNEAGSVVYGSATPGSDAVTVKLATAIPAPLGSTAAYRVRIVPRSHAEMPVPVLGRTHRIGGRVTGVVVTNPITYADTASGFVTIDNQSPANPGWGTITVASRSVSLAWGNPAGDFAQAIVVKRVGAPVYGDPVEGATLAAGGAVGAGTVLYAGTGTATAEASLTDGTAYHYELYAKDACGNYSVGAPLGPVVPPGPGEGDPTRGSRKPVVSIWNPLGGGAVSGRFRVQVRVFSPPAANGTVQAITAVALNTDGKLSTYPIALTRNASYGTAPESGVYEGILDLAPGSYALRARATNASGSVASAAASIRVNAAGFGDGTLLVRDNSNQLCTDCHALQGHSSEASGSKYGSWSTTCRDCHAPHGTPNVFIVKDQITAPAVSGVQPPRAVHFSKRTGYAATGGAADKASASYANPDNTGPCQVCHTRTQAVDGTPRFRATGASDAHYAGPTQRCTSCHSHDSGFVGKTCVECHVAAGDVDSYATGDNAVAKIAQSEYLAFGHGRTTAFPSGNGASAFTGQGSALGDDGCYYCHTSSSGHGDAGNFYRLANLSLGKNGTCEVCHSPHHEGYDPDGAGPDYANKDGKNARADHDGPRHVDPNHNGGALCWDCHDPHGDLSAGGNVLWYMMQRAPVEQNAPNGLPLLFASAIEFRGDLGGDPGVIDYPDYVAGSICANCHDAWSATTGAGAGHYNKTTSDGHGTTPGMSQRNRCTDCHVHTLSCDTCHSAPPTSGLHAQHNETSHSPSSYSEVESEAMVTEYGYKCAKCHSGTHANSEATHAGTLADPLPNEVVFDTTTNPKNPGGTFAPGSISAPVRGADGKWYSSSNGTCSNVYCHSRANPLGGTNGYSTVTWSTGALGCTSCHDTGGASSTLSPAHRVHTDTRYRYDCLACHRTSGSATAIVDKRVHADGVKDVAFDSSGADNSGGAYAPAAYTCSNTYCHSNGTDRSAPYVSGPSAPWNGNAGCLSCHAGNAGSGAPLATGKHGEHVNNADVIGVNLACAACHASVVASDTSISTAGYARHVNGLADVAMTTGTYSGGSCNANYCHSSGQPAAVNQLYPIAWNAPPIGCDGCHGRHSDAAFVPVGGEPNYTSAGGGVAKANSHREHLTEVGQCQDCHAGIVTPAGTAVALGSTLHLDGARDVRISAAWDRNGGTPADNYNATTKTCTSVACHGTGTAVWGAKLACTSCHGMDAPTSTLSVAHRIHTEDGRYNYDCAVCHVTSATGTAIVDRRVHANGETNVAFDASGMNNSGATWSGAPASTCSSTYCHSDGTSRVAPYTSGPSIGWTTTGTCRSCHAGNATAAPTIATGKHLEHVDNAIGANVGCAACHASVVTTDTTVSASGYATHVNGVPDVAMATGSYAVGSCSSNACHSSGQAAAVNQAYPVSWTDGALGCDGCHGRHTDAAFVPLAGEPNYANTGAGAPAANSHREHLTAATQCQDCHAGIVTASGTDIAGRSPLHLNGVRDVRIAAAWDTNGGTPADNYTAASKTCSNVSCHGAGTAAWGAKLTCASCHTGPSDVNNWALADGVVSIVSTTEWTTRGHGTAAIGFPGDGCAYCHSASATHADGTNPFRLANFDATGDGWNSNCLVCHKSDAAGYDPGSGLRTATKKNDAYHLGPDHAANDGGRRCWDCHDPHGDSNIKMIGRDVLVDAADEHGLQGTRAATPVVFTANTTGTSYAKSAAPFDGICNVCHTTTSHYLATSGDAHYATTSCVTCHPHSQPPADAFKAQGGGDCLACHAGTAGTYRPIEPDFSLQSHHVGNGGTMGGSLTNRDCIVCHAEGELANGSAATTTLHSNAKIDLRNADGAGSYAYDAAAVRASAGAATNWNSANEAWRTETSQRLDPFCLSCHDADGASTAFALGDAGALAQNPFADGAITNNYDQRARPKITDVKSKVSGVSPPQGLFARHAIRGQSSSVYTKYTALGGTYKSMYEYGGFTNQGTDENGKPVWNDTSVMGCADCHTVDGANGAAGNAHGSGSEYLLKDASGGAAEGTFAARTYVCYKCHTTTKYEGSPHTGATADWIDTTGQTAANRVAGNGSWAGYACGNCHGTIQYGGIHGTSEVLPIGTSNNTATRNAYRFTNGASLRYYDPQGWTGTSATCYTLSAADGWGGCTKHGGTLGSRGLSGGSTRTKPIVRPLPGTSAY